MWAVQLRCDAPSDQSAPCTRCQELEQTCEMDTSYKRVNKKMKLEELSAQVEHLLATVATKSLSPALSWDTQDGLVFDEGPDDDCQIRDNASLSGTDAARLPFGTDYFDSLDPPSAFKGCADSRNIQPTPSDDNRLRSCVTRKLEDVVVSMEQIDRLFTEYFDHYHRFLRLLDPTCSPDHYYGKSPFLFWTIISVAARRFDEEPTLLASLRNSVTKLAWAEISSLPHTIDTIKGLLLLCCWPFPVGSEASDVTSVFISIAMQMARKLGLHNPQNSQDFLGYKFRPSREQTHDMIKTWSACNIVAHSYSASSGQWSLFAQDWIIDQACEPGNSLSLPDGLRHRGVPFEQERIRMLKQLRDDLDELQSSLYPNLGSIDKLHFCALRFQLESYYFYDLADANARRQGLLRAYSNACIFITGLLDEDKATELFLYSSYELLRVLWQAMQIISDILISVYAHHVVSEVGHRLFHAGIAGTKRASVENNDMPGRLSVIMSQLWRMRNARVDPLLEEPRLRIKSRLGASTLYNWLWYWRESFAGQTNAYPPSPPVSLILPGQFEGSGSESFLDINPGPPKELGDNSHWGIDWTSNLGASADFLGSWTF
ncbi:hypothetical protein N7510_010520 [Penicillium lagena]|uniref:uncharacterized protein n=1 Tax=Penicillium lagena TaxID=94218 RepID=UPI00253FB8B4|nr:uncharacterized protein N7510_010520 [Penicillium lagena]KAJ5605366.1 hypothetical protein N7510_010520 [Penicillium lagena]